MEYVAYQRFSEPKLLGWTARYRVDACSPWQELQALHSTKSAAEAAAIGRIIKASESGAQCTRPHGPALEPDRRQQAGTIKT
jgi:hypothetical protein